MNVEGNDSKMVKLNYKSLQICGVQIFGIWQTEDIYVRTKGFPYEKSSWEFMLR